MYDNCPQCGDTTAVRYDEEILECASCRTPLRESWLNSEEWRIVEDYAEV